MVTQFAAYGCSARTSLGMALPDGLFPGIRGTAL